MVIHEIVLVCKLLFPSQRHEAQHTAKMVDQSPNPGQAQAQSNPGQAQAQSNPGQAQAPLNPGQAEVRYGNFTPESTLAPDEERLRADQARRETEAAVVAGPSSQSQPLARVREDDGADESYDPNKISPEVHRVLDDRSTEPHVVLGVKENALQAENVEAWIRVMKLIHPKYNDSAKTEQALGSKCACRCVQRIQTNIASSRGQRRCSQIESTAR